MQKKPADRFVSMRKMIEAINDFRSESLIQNYG